MKKTISLFIFILLFLRVSIGQTEFEVVKDIYLKANPDSYSDNLMLIPAGKIVKKDIASDYPFIRITYNGEVGYLSLNDLKIYIKPEEKTNTSDEPPEKPDKPSDEPPEKPDEPSDEPVVETIPWLERLWFFRYILIAITGILLILLIWRILYRAAKEKAKLRAEEEDVIWQNAKKVVEQAITNFESVKRNIAEAKTNKNALTFDINQIFTKVDKELKYQSWKSKKAREAVLELKKEFDELNLSVTEVYIQYDKEKDYTNHELDIIQNKTFKLSDYDVNKVSERVKIASELVLLASEKVIAKSKSINSALIRAKSLLDDAIKDENIVVNTSVLNYVNYSFKGTNKINSYPILHFPQKGCIVKSHKPIKIGRRGYKELDFQASIETLFGNNFEVLGNVSLTTGRYTRPFEPDIAMIDKNFNMNLRIDIEIDEPYAGITRQPTHCIGEDTYRDIYFKDRGWIVIRFSEYQVHLFEKSCLKFIAETIKSAISIFEIPSGLTNVNNLDEYPLWDILQAQKWEEKKYREEYLKHKFQKEDILPLKLKENLLPQDILEESKVINTFVGKIDNSNQIGFNELNQTGRDERVKFYSEPHIYKIDSVPVNSVSTIIDKFFPVFDTKKWAEKKAPLLNMSPFEVEEMWKEKGELSAKDGKILHEQIEKYFLNNENFTSKEFGLFKDFMIDNPQISPFRTEWRIFDEEYLVAGTIDLVSKNRNEYEIYDWKRSHRIIDFDKKPKIKGHVGKHGIGELFHVADTQYNRYCLQQSMYKFILEKNYGIIIKTMYIVVLHPDYDKFYKFPIPYYKKEIEFILNSM
jgi:hypothetical protein